MPAPDRLFYLAEESNLASIRKHGLMSTDRLLALAGFPDSARQIMLRQHRPDCVMLPNGVLIRDQKPMPPAALAPALSDALTPAEWYAHLNRFVFMWADRARLDRQRAACGTREQVVLVFDGTRLLSEFGACARVSPINSGNARRRAASRSLDTLADYSTWQRGGWSDGCARHRTGPAEYLFAHVIPARSPYLLYIECDPAAVDTSGTRKADVGSWETI